MVGGGRGAVGRTDHNPQETVRFTLKSAHTPETQPRAHVAVFVCVCASVSRQGLNKGLFAGL